MSYVYVMIYKVLEETGFDIGKLINKEEYVEHHIREQLTRLYIIVGVPKAFQFKPKTRNEIKVEKTAKTVNGF